LPHCAAIAVAVAVSVGVSTADDVAAKPKEAAGRLVFLLQYVGTDYAGAVRNGKVVDEGEYAEMTEFALVAAEQYQRIRSFVPPSKTPALDSAFSRLKDLIGARSDPPAVRAVTETAIPVLIEAFTLTPVPKHVPVPERARAAYEENCSPCHGVTGRGDGPRAKELDPAPADFTDPTRMESVAPYVFYNAITFGVPNTAMASFREALSDEERWDLAFRLWIFSAPDPVSGPAVKLSLRDLATRSSVELVPDVIRQAKKGGNFLNETAAKKIIADLRARPKALADHEERLARLRQDLLSSISLLERGELDGAADLVTAAYLNEFEPLEPEIDRTNPGVRQRFERALVDFRAALRRGDRNGAVALAHALEDTVDAASEVFRGARVGTGRAWFFAILALLLAAGAGLILLRRR
jgi:high-affinity iron transporter